MGFRFRRRILIFPGFWLNASKSGISASVGRPGHTVNPNRKGAPTTVGLPGSGLSYSTERQPLSSTEQPGSGSAPTGS
jgi:uncharacterized protein DUF4236